MAEPSRSRLIVTADDFGLSPAVSSGILNAAQNGIVTSTALLVSFPDVEQAVSMLSGAPALEVGIHLNLTSGSPVLPPGQVPSLVGEDGTLHDLSGFLARAMSRRIHRPDVRREWKPSSIGGAVWATASRSSIATSTYTCFRGCGGSGPSWRGATRSRRSGSRPSDQLGGGPFDPKAISLLPLAALARRSARRCGIRHNDYLLEVPAIEATAAVARLCRALQHLGPTGRVFELVCHPGYVDATLERRDPLTAGRLVDLSVVTAPAVRSALEDCGIRLTTFAALTP